MITIHKMCTSYKLRRKLATPLSILLFIIHVPNIVATYHRRYVETCSNIVANCSNIGIMAHGNGSSRNMLISQPFRWLQTLNLTAGIWEHSVEYLAGRCAHRVMCLITY